MRYEYLSQQANVFQKCTGLTVPQFDQVVKDVLPAYGQTEVKRLSRPKRQQVIGGGPPYELVAGDQVLLTVIGLRL